MESIYSGHSHIYFILFRTSSSTSPPFKNTFGHFEKKVAIVSTFLKNQIHTSLISFLCLTLLSLVRRSVGRGDGEFLLFWWNCYLFCFPSLSLKVVHTYKADSMDKWMDKEKV